MTSNQRSRIPYINEKKIPKPNLSYRSNFIRSSSQHTSDTAATPMSWRSISVVFRVAITWPSYVPISEAASDAVRDVVVPSYHERSMGKQDWARNTDQSRPWI